MSVTMHTSTTVSLLVAVLLLPLEHANVAASSVGAQTKTYPLPLVKKMVASVLQHQIADPSRRILNKANIYSTLGTEFKEISRRKRSESQLKSVLTMQDEDRLGTMVGDLMDCLQITGLSLGLVKGGARHAMGFGLADMETGRSVDNETLFGIGSNTMAFTAATIAHLVNTLPVDRRVQWNTPLADILDDFRMPDDMRTAHMTLLDVLTHRTGLGSGKLGVIAGFPPNVTAQELSRRLQFLPDVYPFRNKFYVSEALFVLLSRLCETVAGKNWTALLKETILDPLGMKSTRLSPDAFSIENVALPYILHMGADGLFVQQDLRIFNYHLFENALSVMTSASDMTLWMTHLLKVLKGATTAQAYLREIFEEQVKVSSSGTDRRKSFVPTGHAMGWYTSVYDGMDIYWYDGQSYGYSSFILLAPSLDLGVYVAMNGYDKHFPSAFYLSNYVLELLRGQKSWINVETVCPERTASNSSSSSLSHAFENDLDHKGDSDTTELRTSTQLLLRPVENYVGIYNHGFLGDLTITSEIGENGSFLGMKLGSYLVADLIPTDHRAIFVVNPRLPLSDTDALERQLRMFFSTIAADVLNSVEVIDAHDCKFKTEVADSLKNDIVGEQGTDSKTHPFITICIEYGLESYVFSRNVSFAMDVDQKQQVSLDTTIPTGSVSKTELEVTSTTTSTEQKNRFGSEIVEHQWISSETSVRTEYMTKAEPELSTATPSSTEETDTPKLNTNNIVLIADVPKAVQHEASPEMPADMDVKMSSSPSPKYAETGVLDNPEDDSSTLDAETVARKSASSSTSFAQTDFLSVTETATSSANVGCQQQRFFIKLHSIVLSLCIVLCSVIK